MNYGLYVPDSVRVDIETEQYVERQAYMARTLERLLKDLDPDLDLVRAKSNAPAVFGLVPGCWHVRRKNRGAPDSYYPITHEDGSYMEPHAGIVENLRRNDLTKVGNIKQYLSDKRYREEKAQKKRADLKSEQRKDHIAEDYRAARRVAGESIHRKRWAAG